MALDQKFFKKSTAATGLADQEEGLVLHLDANDVDSYDGDGSIWYDINGHEVNIPLIDKGTNLVLHLNASDTTSYSGIGNTWTDLSTYGNNGAISNTGGTNNPTFESDTRGYFDFEASDGNDNVEVTDSSSLDITTNITLEAWINEESVFNYGRLIWKNGAYALYRGTNGWNFLTGSDILVHNSGIPSTGTWYHIAATYDGAHKKLYINGTLLKTDNETASIPTNNNSLFIAGDGTASRYFDGKVSSVRIYDTALTAAEVGQNYRAGNFLNYSSTITSKHEATQGTLHTNNLQMNLLGSAYSSGATWTDSSGNGNNGAITGTPGYTNEDGDGDYLTFSPGQTSGVGTSSTTRLTVSSFSALQTATAFTIELWLKSSTASSDGMIWNIYDSSSSTRKFSLSWNNSKLRWVVYSASGGYDGDQDLFTTNTFSTNTWLHVTATYNYNNEMKIYVDGVLEGEESSPNFGVNTTTTTQMRIGDRSDGYAVDTQVGQARFYDAALTPAQVTTNYNATKDLYQNSNILTDLRPSDYSSGATWSDSSTKSNNATLNNFSSTVADYYDQELGDFFDISGNDYFSTSITKNWASIPFSVEMWFNTDSRNGEYLWGLNDSAGNGVAASTRGSGNSYHLQFLGSGLIVSAGVVQTNRWYHLVFTSDGTTKKAYLDGELKGTGTTTINSAANGKAFIFGRLGTYNGVYFNGKIGHTRVYEGALSAAQVAQNYLATKNKYPNGHNATIGGSPTWGTNSSPAYNYFGFDSNSEYLSIPDSSNFDLVSNQSLEIWVYNDHSGPQHYINKPGSPGSYAWQLYWQSSNHSFQMHNTGNSAVTVSAGTNSANTWAHIVLTVGDSKDYKLYLNAGTPGTGTLSGTSSTSTVPVTIGRYYPTSTYGLQGRIGMIKFYGKTLSATEVTTAYNNTKGTYGL